MDSSEQLVKEVYAQFGLAYFRSEVLHKGLCHFYIVRGFQNTEDITRPRIEEKLVQAFSLTLGQIIEETKDLFPIELQERLEIALQKRNKLAHHFWFEEAHMMINDDGLSIMIRELYEIGNYFAKLDTELEHYFKPKRQALGVSDEMIEQQMNQLLAGDVEEPIMSQRQPRKQERIVRIWNVKIDGGAITQIFESDDGCLWQLCDVGLGWTRFQKPNIDWEINEIAQKYLPANIKPRPAISSPWNFEFQLSKGAVLWVKRSPKVRSYSLGIRKTQKKM